MIASGFAVSNLFISIKLSGSTNFVASELTNRIITLPRGERSVSFGIDTIDDQEYDLPGFIRAEVLTGGGYQVIDGLDNIKIITIADNDASPVNNLMSIAAIDQFGVPEGCIS